MSGTYIRRRSFYRSNCSCSSSLSAILSHHIFGLLSSIHHCVYSSIYAHHLWRIPAPHSIHPDHLHSLPLPVCTTFLISFHIPIFSVIFGGDIWNSGLWLSFSFLDP
ncbi:hypothetical protein SISNIDRAFT_167205 [Sistotremastrum niveocremeum HHB9708]|uniref:Uncharacterized protein n=1 Tax=Sistotremastrum niveocremeum HHB9708 TaxID=1314777 RepID=A0A164S9R6_9AGAM|nr:hypothetical protein SISNIDRAFT_167205 [Sistotremastrum niveocremeum HHB9708]